jgi:hypothetical protein
MTIRFATYRAAFYVCVLLLSGTVLGVAAHFLTVFSPKTHRDFPIFAIIVPSLSILLFLLSLQWAIPQTEAIELVILGILWLAMGAWSADIIGYVQCDTLGGQSTPTKSGTMSLQAYCYEMKVIEAFSWMTFVLMAFALIVLFQLAAHAQMFGRFNIWYEPIRELPWFGEAPGYYNTTMMGGQMPMTYPGYMQPGMMMPPYVQTAPSGGHTVIVQPGINGQPATVTQV